MSTVGLTDAYLRAKARWPGLTVSLARLTERAVELEIEDAWLAERGLDLILAHAAAMADPVAVAALEQVIAPARGVIQRYTRDPARTDEVMQRLRIHMLVAEAPAVPRLARYDGRAGLGAWINMCAARLALHALRDERARREIALEWSDALSDLPAADPMIEALRVRHAERVAEALRDACLALSRRHRAILRLLFVQGASVDEAATMYQVHRVTVWRWVQEARTALRTATRARLTALGSSDGDGDGDQGTASLIAWVEDQVELSLDGILAPTLTAPSR